MSNQVYSNNTNKFYSKPGMNRYALTATTSVGSGITTGGLNFNTISHEDFPGMIIMDVDNFKVSEEGMYSIMANLNLLNATSPGTNPIDVTANLLLNRVGQFNINLQSIKTSIASPNVGALDKNINFSVCAYLTPVDIISIKITNNSAASSLSVFQTVSTLFINRIY